MTGNLSFRIVSNLLLIFIFLPSLGYSLSRQASITTSSSIPRSAHSVMTKAERGEYIIGDTDLLGINVWDEPDFKESLPVRSDGKITLPLIGAVQAAGRTPSELENSIAARLQAYMHDPVVTVMVLKMNSRKFNILGRVAKPGSYPLSGATTVLDAIADAGGFAEFAKKAHVYVLRQNSKGGESRIPFNYKQVIAGKHSDENILLKPHDTVVVP